MYRPPPKQDEPASNRLKLPTEAGCPSMSKVKFMLDEASNRRGCLVELPWTAGDASFIVTCQWDGSVEEPVWTLYQDEEGNSKVVWTQSFTPSDLEFMYDILVMSAPKGSSSTKMPELLAPGGSDEFALDAPDPYAGDVPNLPDVAAADDSYPQLAPMPQQGLVPGAGAPLPAPASPPQAAPPLQTQQAPQAPPAQPNDSYYNLGSQYPPPQQMPYPPPQGMPGQPMPGQTMPQQGMPPGYPPQYGYQQPPPGYPPQYQQPPGQQSYTAVPSGPYPGAPTQAHDQMANIPLDYHLLDKRPNLLIGIMLKDAGLISEPTLEAALKLQELIREEKLSPDRAPEVLRRLHKHGGNIDQYLTPEDTDFDDRPERKKAKPKPVEPTDKRKPESKAQALASPSQSSGKRNLKPAFDLIEEAGILTDNDIKDALAVRKKHGGDLVGILEAANKLNRKTVDAAFICLPLIREGLLKKEQCIIALNYCSRMRVGFDEALEEMGWQNPRKLRSDLPL